MNRLREWREYAVREALRREREAWSDLEQAARPRDSDALQVRACRERWQDAAQALGDALRALKR